MGVRVKHWRKVRNCSLRKLAVRAQDSHNYIYMLEKGQVPKPSLDRIQRLARALGVPLDVLLVSEPGERTVRQGPIMDPVIKEINSHLLRIREQAPDELKFVLNIVQELPLPPRLQQCNRDNNRR